MRKPQAIATLQRRAEYLRAAAANDEANDYDIAEIAALDMAIQSLTETEQKALNFKGRRKRTALQRRADFLRSTPEDDPRRSYYLGETAALEFAIDVINEHFLHTRPINK